MAVKLLYNIGSQKGGNGYSILFLGQTDDGKKFLTQVEQTGDDTTRKWMFKTRSWAKNHLAGVIDLYIDPKIKLDDLLDDAAPSFVGADGVIADATITNAGILKTKKNADGSVPVFSLLGEGVSAPDFSSTDLTNFTPLSKNATASGFVSSITTFIDQNPVTSLVGFILLVLFIIYVVAPWLQEMNGGKKKKKR